MNMSNGSARSAKELTPGNTAAAQDGVNTTVISVGSKIEGNFQSTENIRFDGYLHGDLACERKLVVGKDGRVEGNVKAKEAVIMGSITGDLSISGLLHLEKSASVRGNIKAGVLSIEEGASYDGICKIGQ